MNYTVIALILLTQVLNAQMELPYCMQYRWDKTPTYTLGGSDTLDFAAVKEKYVVEFLYDENNLLTEYDLEHKVLFVNSDDKIEENNRIYLPHSASSEIIVSKARVITPIGRILELDDSRILVAKDEETGNGTKYFALEGIEKGSFIEFYYVQKRQPYYRGKRLSLQDSYFKKRVEFDLYAPSNLVFDFKSYNGLPAVSKDTAEHNKNHWKLGVDQLAELENEDNSSYSPNLGFLVYKLDRNTTRNIYDISSYGNVSQNLYEYYYSEPTKQSRQRLNKFIAEAIPTTAKDKEDTIRNLESYIKNNVYKSEGNNDSFEELERILQDKVANTTGLVKLYVALFKELDIPHELVITSDRSNTRFDQTFEANNFLTDFLFYFPEYSTYMSPEELDSRYGFPPVTLTDNHGLFIREVVVGNFRSALGEVRYIDPVPASRTVDRMLLEVTFNPDNLLNNNIHMERSFTGYYAMYMQPYMHLVKDKDRDKLIDGMAEFISDNITINSKEVINDDHQLFGKEPIKFVFNIDSEAFTEKAGGKYLFKVGELIGPQMELYHDKDRALPMDNGNQRTYYRTIAITIPEGYTFTNLDDLIINNSFSSGGEELFSFISSYTIEDNKLIIKADEHYSANIIGTDIFNEFRKVINSAADFNKVVLVMGQVSP